MTKHIIAHPYTKNVLNDLKDHGEGGPLLRNELDVRYSLMLDLLTTEKGARQHVTENMTQKEFQRGKTVGGIFFLHS